MKFYYLNKNADVNGNHEIHTSECRYLPAEWNRVYIGVFSSCSPAVQEAKKKYPTWKIDGCYFCSNVCHKG